MKQLLIFFCMFFTIQNVHSDSKLSCIKGICIEKEFTGFELNLSGKHKQNISDCSKYLHVFYKPKTKNGFVDEEWAIWVELVKDGEGNQFSFENSQKQIVTINLRDIVQVRRTKRMEYVGEWKHEAFKIEQYLKSNYGYPSKKFTKPHNQNFIQYHYDFFRESGQAFKQIHIYDEVSEPVSGAVIRLEEVISNQDTVIHPSAVQAGCEAEKYFN